MQKSAGKLFHAFNAHARRPSDCRRSRPCRSSGCSLCNICRCWKYPGARTHAVLTASGDFSSVSCWLGSHRARTAVGPAGASCTEAVPAPRTAPAADLLQHSRQPRQPHPQPAWYSASAVGVVLPGEQQAVAPSRHGPGAGQVQPGCAQPQNRGEMSQQNAAPCRIQRHTAHSPGSPGMR